MYERQVDSTTVMDIISQEKEQLESLLAEELVDHVDDLYNILAVITPLDNRRLTGERKHILLHCTYAEIIETILPYHVLIRTGNF